MSLKDKITQVGQVTGIDIQLPENGGMLIYGVHIAAKHGKVQKVAGFDKATDIKALKEKVSPDIPIVLTINGRGLLLRKKQGIVETGIVNEFFPGTNPNEFYYSVHALDNEIKLVYFSRKNIIDNITDQFLNAGYKVLSVTLGTASVENILPFLNNHSLKIVTAVNNILVIDKKVKEVTIVDNKDKVIYEELPIGNWYYKTNQFLALGKALEVISLPVISIDSDINNTSVSAGKTDFFYYKLFKFTGWSMLISILIILLLNFIIFNHYFEKNNELVKNQSALLNENQEKAIVNARFDSSYNFFVRSGWNNSTKHGYYVDRIAALVPESISLLSLVTSPLEETNELNNIVFNHTKVLITGNAVNPTDLDIFSRALKNISGVHSVAIKDYVYKTDTKSGLFSIEIILESQNV